MAVSMTGFGRGKVEKENRELNIELKTLNHRYLDIIIKMPRVLSFLEEEIRKHISKHFTRGRVEIYISYNNNVQDQLDIKLNDAVVEAYKKAFDDLAQYFSLFQKPSYEALMSIPDLFIINEKEEDEDMLRELLFEALDLCIVSVKNMREIEGMNLADDILSRNDMLLDMVNKVEARAPLVVQEYKQKLESRLKELLSTTELDEARFNVEVAYIADRSNITEELTRLKSHIKQLAQIIEDGGSIGRKLDFLVQEMNREVNTIGSKASDLIITNLVVDMKSEIEKMREQIQNLE